MELPEGAQVRVETIDSGLPEPSGLEAAPSIFDAGDCAVKTGISDLAANIDQYLNGCR